MADQTQTQQVATPVSFDDVSLEHLSFSESFRVTRGAASQVVLGLRNMLEKLKTPTNEYQKDIYPQLSSLTQELCSKYVSTFLTTKDAVQRQVTGANLNGHRNDGSLYRSVNSGVNRSLTYGYAQFGQLVKVLTNRLQFVVSRDPQTVQRYKDSATECAAYVALQTQCTDFLKYMTTVNDKWTAVVEASRKTHNIQKQKPVRPQRTPRVPREQRSQGGEERTQEWVKVDKTQGRGRGGRSSGRGGSTSRTERAKQALNSS